MTVAQLIALLQKCPQEKQVMILDGFNGGGHPRDINYGPVERTIKDTNEVHTVDCEDRVGEVIIALGYGCY